MLLKNNAQGRMLSIEWEVSQRPLSDEGILLGRNEKD